jgi:hypothetical protein
MMEIGCRLGLAREREKELIAGPSRRADKVIEIYEAFQIRVFARAAFRTKAQHASPRPSLQIGLSDRFGSRQRL